MLPRTMKATSLTVGAENGQSGGEGWKKMLPRRCWVQFRRLSPLHPWRPAVWKA